eukprot:192740-Rhodomonas_salina.1
MDKKRNEDKIHTPIWEARAFARSGFLFALLDSNTRTSRSDEVGSSTLSAHATLAYMAPTQSQRRHRSAVVVAASTSTDHHRPPPTWHKERCRGKEGGPK